MSFGVSPAEETAESRLYSGMIFLAFGRHLPLSRSHILTAPNGLTIHRETHLEVAFVDRWDFTPRLSKAPISWKEATVTQASDFKQVSALKHTGLDLLRKWKPSITDALVHTTWS